MNFISAFDGARWWIESRILNILSGYGFPMQQMVWLLYPEDKGWAKYGWHCERLP